MSIAFVLRCLIASTGVSIGWWGGDAAAAAPLADPTSTIYLQRGADGRLVLTDRPSPLVTTERSWQVEREDPVAARQRAADVRREATAVSERVQRAIDQDERQRAEVDARERDRADRLARDAAIARAAEAETPLLVAPIDVFGGTWRPPHALDDRVSPRRRGQADRRDRRDRHDARDPQRRPRAWRRAPAGAVEEPATTPGRR